ncbi:MAG: translocation/assembly module TamB domain-containing protein, partial [candidate division KSB1 bacterium]|nr:translocation/assembly module TamB domain-containing protein [candidate division KSB1 bacterium]
RYHFEERSIYSGHIDGAIQLDLLNHLLADPDQTSYQGQLSLSADFSGPIDQLCASMRLQLDQGKLVKLPIEGLHAELSLQDETLQLIDLSAAMLKGNISAHGKLGFADDSMKYHLVLSLDRLDLNGLLQKLSAKSTDLIQGQLNAQFSLTGNTSDWLGMTASADFRLSQLEINSQKFSEIVGHLSYSYRNIHFLLDENGSQLQFLGHIEPDQSITGQLNANLLDVAPLASISGLFGLTGQLRLNALLSGSISSPIATIELHVRDGKFQGFPVNELDATALYESRQVKISHLLATGWSGELWPLAESLALDTLAGNLRYKISAQGTFQNLISQIEVQLDEPRINDIKLEHAKLFASSAGTILTIDSLQIYWLNYWLTASGQFHWQPALATEMLFTIHSKDSLTEKKETYGSLLLHGKLSHRLLQATLVGKSISPAPFAQLLGKTESIGGVLSFDASAHGRLDHPEFTFRGRWHHPTYRGHSLDSVATDFEYRDRMLTIAQFQATSDHGILTIEGRWPILPEGNKISEPSHPKLSLSADNFDLGFITGFLPDSLQVSGKFSGEIDLKGWRPQPKLTGHFKIDDAITKLPNLMLSSLELQANFKDSEFQMEQFSGKINQFPFRFQGEAHFEPFARFETRLHGEVMNLAQLQFQFKRNEDHAIVGSLNVSEFNLSHLFELLSIDLQPKGEIDIRAEISGTDSNPTIAVMLHSSKIAYETAQLDSLILRATYSNHQISLTQSGAKVGDGLVRLEGQLPLAVLINDSSKTSDQLLQFHFTAQELAIDWLRPFFPGLELLRGKVNSRVLFSGTLGQPKAEGSIDLNSGLIKLKGIEPEISDISCRIEFLGDTVTIANLTGKAGTGSFLAQGWTIFSENGLSATNFNLSMERIKLTLPKIAMAGIERGEMTLVQSGENYRIQGNIRLSETRYIQDFRPRLSQFLTRLPSRSSIEPDPALNHLQLDILFQGNENIWIDNNLAKLQLSANLNLTGTLAQPNIAGRVIIHKGYVLYLDRKFRLTSGSLYFSDPQRINPLIDVTAVSEVTDYQGSKETKYTVTLKLSGLLEKLDFSLTSDPVLDRANIVSLLTLGRTRETLIPQSSNGQRTSLQQVMLTRFQELGAHRLADFTEQKLSEALDLENITIEGNLLRWDRAWAPRITASKRLSDRFNITYSTVVGHATEQQIKLGYQFSKYFSIIGNTGQVGQSGLDLKFHYKFY